MSKTTYPITIAGVSRELPLCPLNEDLQIAAFVIFGDPELTVVSAAALLKLAPTYDYIITAESKGIPLAHEMARQNGDTKYLLARKSQKLYMRNIYSIQVDSITTTATQTLYIDGADAELIRGKRILIVDDVISTGNSLHALEALIQSAGGTIAGRMTILAEGDATTRDDIVFLEPLPLFNYNGDPV